MTRPTFSEIVGAGVLAIVVAGCLAYSYILRTECSARGGVVVRAQILWECIDAKALK